MVIPGLSSTEDRRLVGAPHSKELGQDPATGIDRAAPIHDQDEFVRNATARLLARYAALMTRLVAD